MSAVFNAYKSEIRKFLTVKTSAFFLLITPIFFLTIAFFVMSERVGFSVLNGSMQVLFYIALILGSNLVTGDIKDKMSAQAFLTQPRRWHWVVAKMAFLVTYLFFVLAISLIIDVLLAQFKGGFNTDAALIFFQGVYAAVIYSFFGLAVGLIIRRPMSGVITLMWFFLVESIVILAVDIALEDVDTDFRIGSYLPGTLQRHLLTQEMDPNTILWTALIVTTLWTALLLVLGFMRNNKADTK